MYTNAKTSKRVAEDSPELGPSPMAVVEVATDLPVKQEEAVTEEAKQKKASSSSLLESVLEEEEELKSEQVDGQSSSKTVASNRPGSASKKSKTPTSSPSHKTVEKATA